MNSEVRGGATIGSLALRALRRYPDRTALSWDGGRLTYAQALDRIGRYQHVLHRHGLRRGQRIALLSANRATSWCAGIAAQASGLGVTWLNGRGSLDDHLFQLADADACAVIVDEQHHSARGTELTAKVGADLTVLSVGPAEFAADLDTVGDRAGASTARDVAAPQDIAVIHYTGGTTGRPKGVMRTHRAATVMFDSAVLAGFALPRTPRYLATAPISHVGGTKLLPALLLGGSIHMQPDFEPGAVLAAIARERINTTLLVPTMIYALLDHPELERTDLDCLELMLYGAGPMSPTRLREAMARIGPVFSQLYGQTECYPICALSTFDHRDGLLDSCGIPVPTSEVTLLTEDGTQADVGQVGEICVRSAATMDEYWKQPELTAETILDGWLRTGDLARMDERGYLFIVDRKKDMIISGGFNVYSQEVEDALASHPAVVESAVFGLRDERWGEAVAAAVVVRAGDPVTGAELAEHVRRLKGPVQAPKACHIVESIPRTSLGKIDKKRLREQFQNAG